MDWRGQDRPVLKAACVARPDGLPEKWAEVLYHYNSIKEKV